ncbi:MAG: A/G-specific adenine glycosylase [Faecalicatena sp.]|uniref:A/G-specific adenine glycosylase n=1 Tax=Faecalicatena sp. TaxID=2005360 RepID=UPI00258D1E00|nr:A/G-specific adenine glycosylase [Faecalicatena sp.]MCI6466524.1 A/G-specific adenine glycosylase [Faecalicatena sp.]MDY5617899.1 A/G-specific adenine glycosylase [Lachnospiraceae bacterium]
MRYERIEKAVFLERPNRFIAYAEINGRKETIHVKNTGRCAELLRPRADIYVQKSDNPERKTKWDLIAVEKGSTMVNMDSQIPNRVVQEWIEGGGLFGDAPYVRPETTYGNSRFDLYVETREPENRRIFIEVKGVTLEENGVARFPDAPSERAVKHVEELCQAVKDGYEAYIIFVIQMKGIRYFTPNVDTQPAFGEALKKARASGVNILAYDCQVTPDSIVLDEPVSVVLGNPILKEATVPLIRWYREHKRDLPWRHDISAYRVWVSEIMLQQTRVEAVKPYYDRFLRKLPTVKELAEVEEDQLLKLWEGLGYYNRVRNMQKAAQQIMVDFHGEFPETYEEILSLTGIGSYTAGAISSFAYGLPKPAVDGNVLRVVSRLLASEEDIMKASVRADIEKTLEEVIPADAPGDFNQGLIELGAIVCVPNGEPKCEECPAAQLCQARAKGIETKLPVKAKAKARRIEKRTVLIFKDGDTLAIRKRPSKGLLAGLYELPNLEGHLTRKQVIEYSNSIGLAPIHVKKAEKAKHIFSHVEWHMIGYEIKVDELEKNCSEEMIFARKSELEEKYPIPSAFEAYRGSLI